MGSPQTLSQTDRRIVAAWAADCAERVLGLFEAEAPGDARPREAIARTRAFARGELDVAEEIRRRFIAGGAAREVTAPAASAAARAAGQAASVPHMGAHALGAAAYAAKAAGLAAADQPDVVGKEIRWQLEHLSAASKAALRRLPPVGENSSGPLGPGVLASGLLGTIVRDLQAGLADPDGERVGALTDTYMGRDRPLGEARVLWEIGADACELARLRARLALDSGYLSRLLASLQADGLVQVAEDPRDRRARVARLTSHGRRERTTLDARSDELASTLLDPLSSSQRELLLGRWPRSSGC